MFLFALQHNLSWAGLTVAAVSVPNATIRFGAAWTSVTIHVVSLSVYIILSTLFNCSLGANLVRALPCNESSHSVFNCHSHLSS